MIRQSPLARTLIVIATVLAATPTFGASWQVRTIAEYGQIYRQSELVVDAAGIVHVLSYPIFGVGGPSYVTNRSGQFATESFPGSDLDGIRPILTSDAQGLPVFVAPMEFGATVALYREAAGTWTPTPIDLPNVAAIAFDRANHPHVLYFGDHCDLGECGCGANEFRLEIRYGTDASGAWANEGALRECRPETLPGWIQDLVAAVDPAGKVYAAWLDAGTLQVRYATNATGAWVTGVIAEVGTDTPAWAHPLDLAVDSIGHPHVVFYDDRDPDLAVYYATDSGPGWRRVKLGGLTAYPTIVVDSRDVVHVVFDSPWRGEMSHATHAISRPIDDWQTERVARVEQDSVPDLALDQTGKLHVAYYETPAQALRYATTSGGGSGNGGGTISEETSIEQLAQKPVIRVSCVRTAAGSRDAFVAQAFEVVGSGTTFGAFVVQGAGGVDATADSPVTKEVTKKLGRRSVATTLKLKLSPIAKKLLKDGRALDVEVRVHMKSDPPVVLKRLTRLVRDG